MKKKYTVKLVLVATVTVSIALKIMWSLPYQSQQVWQGYQVALIEQSAEIDLEALAADLREAGFTRIISYKNQQVTLFRYFGESRIHTVKLQALPQLLEPQDPRYDDYLKGLANYFQGKLDGRKAEVLYLEHPDKDIGAVLEGRRVLEELGVPYYLSGIDPLRHIVLWICAGITLLTVMLLFPKKHRIRGTLLVWTVGAIAPLAGSIQISMSSFTWWTAHLIGWTLLMAWAGPAMKRYLNSDSEDRFFIRALKKYAFLYFGLVLIGVAAGHLGLLGYETRSGLILSGQSVLTLCIQFGLLYGFYGFHKKLSQRQLHSLFVPVAITAKPQVSPSSLRVRTAVFVFVAGVIPLTILPIIGETAAVAAEYPMPEQTAAEADSNSAGTHALQAKEPPVSWQELAAAARSRNSGPDDNPSAGGPDRGPGGVSGGANQQLPDLTDYLKHRAFQEGYFYGRSYSFPEPGEKITVPVYRQEGIEVFTRDKVVKMFTDEWYKDIIGFAYNNGVPRLLLAQGTPVQVQVGTLEPFRIGTYAILGHISVLLILVPVVFFIVSRKVISQSFLNEKQQLKKGQKVA